MTFTPEWKERFVSITAVALIFLFAYTAIAKLMNLRNFRFALMQQDYLEPYANVISTAVPLVEIIIVFVLTVPAFRKAGLILSALVMTLFTVYVGLMLLASSSL